MPIRYHVKDSHPAIVSSEVWDLVQIEVERRKTLGKHYSSGGVFASRVVCGDCGGFYGAKVWHSTDPYRTIIWRCNGKYTTSEKKQKTWTTVIRNNNSANSSETGGSMLITWKKDRSDRKSLK